MARVATHLMFQDGQASAALDLYAAVFPDFTVTGLDRYREGEGGPPGWVRFARVAFGGQDLVVIDSPVSHEFGFTPSTSLFVTFDDAAKLRDAVARLSDGGTVLMPPGDYGFSRLYAWLQDRFGVSWQLNLAGADFDDR